MDWPLMTLQGRNWSCWFGATCVVVAVFGVASPARAQVVTGHVRSSESGTPIPMALVTLVDDEGVEWRRVLTEASGRFSVPAPSERQWTVVVEALGFETYRDTVSAGDWEAGPLDLLLAPRPIGLPGLEVGVKRRCGERSGAPGVIDAWSYARGLFSSYFEPTQARQYRLRYELTVARVLPREGGYKQDPIVESVDTAWLTESIPVQDRDAAELAEDGFIVPVVPGLDMTYDYAYYLPDPGVLLSSEFLETHCFFLRPESDGGDWIGLGFEPDRVSDLEYDVEGTLWMPTRAGGFPRIEFRHTHYPRESELWFYGGPRQAANWGFQLDALGDRVGGSMSLSLVPDIGWVVHELELRVPYVRRHQAPVAGSDFRPYLRRGENIRNLEGCCGLTFPAHWYLHHVELRRFVLLSAQTGGG